MGDAAAAREMIEEAIAIVERTDFLFDRGTVYLDRAEVMELLGHDEDARSGPGARARDVRGEGRPRFGGPDPPPSRARLTAVRSAITSVRLNAVRANLAKSIDEKGAATMKLTNHHRRSPSTE